MRTQAFKQPCISHIQIDEFHDELTTVFCILFSMNEYNTKLRKADWLEYICFQPYVSDAIVR